MPPMQKVTCSVVYHPTPTIEITANTERRRTHPSAARFVFLRIVQVAIRAGGLFRQIRPTYSTVHPFAEAVDSLLLYFP